MYRDASLPEVLASHGDTVAAIKASGLEYPVTVIDGAPSYDGAVSYPAILRAVQSKLGDS